MGERTTIRNDILHGDLVSLCIYSTVSRVSWFRLAYSCRLLWSIGDHKVITYHIYSNSSCRPPLVYGGRFSGNKKRKDKNMKRQRSHGKSSLLLLPFRVSGTAVCDNTRCTSTQECKCNTPVYYYNCCIGFCYYYTTCLHGASLPKNKKLLPRGGPHHQFIEPTQPVLFSPMFFIDWCPNATASSPRKCETKTQNSNVAMHNVPESTQKQKRHHVFGTSSTKVPAGELKTGCPILDPFAS